MINLSYIQEDIARKAKQSGIETDDFKQFVSLVHAHADLKGLVLLLENLNEIIPLALDISDLNSDHSTIRPLIDKAGDTTKKLLNMKQLFQSEGLSSFFESLTHSRYDIFNKTLTKFPLYSCLGILPVSKKRIEELRILQAQLLLFSARHFAQSLMSHLNLFRAVRDLCKLKHLNDLFGLPSQLLPSLEYFQQLNASSSERLRIIGKLVNEAPQPVDLTQKARKSPATEQKKRTVRKNPIQRTKALPKSRRTLLTNKEAKKFRALGGNPSEIQPPHEEISIAIPETIISGFTYRNLCFLAKSESNRRALSNQLLPHAWDELNLHDLSVLLSYLQGKHKQSTDPILGTIDARAAIYLSFFLSRPVQDLMKFRFYNAGAPITNKEEGILADGQGQLMARLYTPGPELSEYNRSLKWMQAQEVKDSSLIPLPNICSELADFFDPATNRTAPYLFSAEYSHLNVRVDKVISTLRKTGNCRLSPARISRFVVNELSRMEGEDLPKAVLYLGLDHDLATTRVHYTIAHLPTVEKNYRSLCRKLFQQTGLSDPYGYDAPMVSQPVYVGSPFCPRLDAVQDLTAKIKENLALLQPDDADRQKLVAYHNKFTLYTALMTAYASGYRAVTDRFFSAHELDHHTGWAVISDKDTPDFYNTRQVWVHSMCREQLNFYRHHLTVLYNFIGLVSPPLFQLFRDNAWPDILGDFFLFADTEGNHVTKLTPSILKAKLTEDYQFDLPPNSNRHFLKNQLSKSNCPQEVIEGFLGHWHNGQEPWNNLSGLHPADFRSELEHHLSHILADCGWCIVPGLTS